MNWDLHNFDWNRAKAFLAAADTGSFSAAAKQLRLTQPTLGRQVAALEKELGLVLFEKVGNTIALTPSGRSLLKHVRDMALAAEHISLSVSGHSQEIKGKVSISSSEIYGVEVLPEVLVKLHKLQPHLEIDLILDNRASDLNRREADIAIRNFRPQQAELITKKINARSFSFYAAPSYLEEIGYPKVLQDLANARFIAFMEKAPLIAGLKGCGLQLHESQFVFTTNSLLTQWQLLKAGAGIGIMIANIGDLDKEVRELLPGLLPKMEIENWLVCHRELKSSKKFKFVFDFLFRELSEKL